MFKYTPETISYHNNLIQTYSFGDADKVIFSLPSYPHSGLSYIFFTQYYDPAKFRFITFDIPGWAGLSQNIFKGKEFDIDLIINIAIKVLENYHVETFSLIGYSFGSAISVKLAKTLGNRITSLVLVSPFINSNLLTRNKEKTVINFAYKHKLGKLIKMYVLRKFKTYDLKTYPEQLIKLYYFFLKNADSKVLLDSIHWLFNANLEADLSALKIIGEILIVNSKTETLYFREQSRFIRTKLAAEDSLKISGNHEDFLLKPKSAIVKKVLEFLLYPN